MIRTHFRSIVMAVSALAALTLPAFPDSFGITIDTSALGLNLKGPGELALELSNGPSTSDTISVSVSNFNLGGGAAGPVRMSQGVNGSFTSGSTSLVMNNSFQTSFYDQYVTFANTLSLITTFTFVPPTSGLPDATSDFRVLVGPANFNSSNGVTAVQISYGPNGVPTITHVPAANVTTAVPEPAWLAPAGLLLLGAALAIRRFSAAGWQPRSRA